MPSFEGAKRALLLPNLGRRSGTTDGQTDTQTNRKVPPPAKTYRIARALFSRGRLISEASLPVFHGGGEGHVQYSTVL